MSGNLLINEPPIIILPSLVRAIGLTEAIILQQMHFWLSVDGIGKEIDGTKWVYNSIKGWKKNFPWWSERTIWQAIHNLEEMGLVVSDTHNVMLQDRTKWYRINYDQLAETGDSSQNLQPDSEKIARPLPETTSKEGNTTYSGDQPAPPASPVRQPSQRKVVPVELISLFCHESGVPELEPSSKKEYAEYQTLWHKPLYHVHHVLCADNQAESTALIRQSIQQMRERELDISSPNSIKKVATAIKARNNRPRVVSVY